MPPDPGSDVAQDPGSEYITISENSRSTGVTLPESNAVAVLDTVVTGDPGTEGGMVIEADQSPIPGVAVLEVRTATA